MPSPAWRFERGHWQKPKLEVPDHSILGASALNDFFKMACVLPLSSAASTLEGVHQLIVHQPDLCEFADALALIVEGERKLLALREHLACTDAEFEAAFEAPFVASVPLLGFQLRRMAQLVPALAEYVAAHERIERGAATMTGLSCYLASL